MMGPACKGREKISSMAMLSAATSTALVLLIADIRKLWIFDKLE